MLAAGLALGAFTLYKFSRLSLDAGYWDLFFPQFIQGFALAMLFVPLTTITMSQVSQQAMGNATSLFNLMRNIGGSIGIAMVTTLDARFAQKYINQLGAHVTPYDPPAAALLDGLRANASGAGPVAANQSAIGTVFGMVQRQASMSAFIQLFLVLALIFLAMIPLILIMKRPSKGAKAEMGH